MTATGISLPEAERSIASSSNARGACDREVLAAKHNQAPRMKARLLSFGFSLLLQPQNMWAYRIEPLFGGIAEQRILMTGDGRSDLRPILRLKGLKRGRKEISIFHHHLVPFVRDEIANNGIDILPKNFTFREYVLDRVSDAAQAFSPFMVFASEITDLRSRNRIARS